VPTDERRVVGRIRYFTREQKRSPRRSYLTGNALNFEVPAPSLGWMVADSDIWPDRAFWESRGIDPQIPAA
jgi:hypothetical protein